MLDDENQVISMNMGLMVGEIYVTLIFGSH